jgi:hypothetical protein
MPNYCDNNITIRGKAKAINAIYQQCLRDDVDLCEAVRPIPKELNITAGSLGGDDNPEQKALEQKEQANLAKHGYKNWYDWCVDNWGTKWDLCDAKYEYEDAGDGEAQLVIDCQTAWGPPLAVYEHLESKGYYVYATYNEGGMGFAGIWEGGHDDHYNYGDMSPEEVKATLPEDLNEQYGISEWLEANQDREDLSTWMQEGAEAKKETANG